MVNPGTAPILTCVGNGVYDASGNNNGHLNPGETANLTSKLRNVGGSDLNNVSTTISSTNPYVTITDNYGYFGSMPFGVTKENTTDPYTVSASSSASQGYLTFKLIATGANGFLDTFDFNIMLYTPVLTYQSHSVMNGTGVLLPGQTANLSVTIYNQGNEIAQNVTATLKTSSPYITINDSTGTFGTINPNEPASNSSNPYNVSASASTPSGSSIIFSMIVHAGTYYTDTLNFTLVVGQQTPILTYQGNTVMNGSGVLLPGETTNLSVSIKNEGTVAAQNVTSTLMTASPYITINDNSGNYGTINPGVTVTNTSDPYNITASPSTPSGVPISFSIIVQSGTYCDTLNFSIIPGQSQTVNLTYQSYTVMNSSGVLLPGETANLSITIKNQGTAPAQNVTSTLMESSPYITINDNSGTFGTINPGATATNTSNPYNIAASTSTPYGAQINFSVIVQAGSYCDTLSFTLTMGQAPNLVYQSYTIVNSSGILMPGETSNLTVTIQNQGTSTAQNVTSTLLSSSPYITISDNSGSYGTINPGSSATNSTNPYTITASASTPYGAQINFSLIVQSYSYVDTLFFTLTMGQAPNLTYQGYTVMNTAGVLLPGQTTNLAVSIKNQGTSPVQNVTTNLVTSSSYITINDNSGNFGTINPGATITNTSDPYNITASSSTPQGYSISFSIIVHSGIFTDTLNFVLVTGTSPILIYQNYTVMNTSGILLPGEAANLSITLQNTGSAVAQNVTSTLMTSSPYITINDNSGSFGTINPGAMATNTSNPYNIMANASTPYGASIAFSVIVVSGTYIDTLNFSLVIGQAPLLTYQGHTVVNSTGFLNPGETVNLVVSIKNQGNGIAQNVTSTLTTASPYITINDGTSNFGTINPGATVNNASNPYNISANTGTPYGSSMNFSIIVQAGAYVDTLPFTLVMAQAPVLTYQGYTVMNSAGILLPGETANLSISIKNDGATVAQNVTSTLLTSSSYITINDASGNFGTINPGSTVINSSDPYNITALSSVPFGTQINFSAIIQAGSYCDTLNFILVIAQAPILTYQSYSVMNNTGVLNPGETANLTVTIKNDGSTPAQNVNSTLFSSSSYITINDNSGNFGSINPGATANNLSDPYTITADASTPYATPVDFSVIVQAGTYTDTLDFTLVVGQLVPSDTGYYYAYYSGSAYAHAPVFQWIAIDTTQSVIQGVSLDLHRNQTVMVNLPFSFRYYGVNYNRISICSNGWIAMDSTLSTDYSNTGIPNLDGPQAMIAGLWTVLEPGNAGAASDVYYYYEAATHRFIIEYFRVEHYPNGDPETFEFILCDPAYYPTPTGDGEIIVQYLPSIQRPESITVGIENRSQTVGIQYLYNGDYDSLAIAISDSFAIKYTTYAPSQPPGVSEFYGSNQTLSITKLSAYPSIAKGHAYIDYQLANPEPNVEIKIYDATGRLVRRFINITIQPFNQIIWDAKDNSGCSVPEGIYFVKLESSSYRQVCKVILVK